MLCFHAHVRVLLFYALIVIRVLFETLILFVMNHGEREKGRANSVNTCSNCSRSSVRSFRVSAHRLDSII